ncbi:MAG: hypothetical protein NT004_13675, partial [Bacteroidetes bacterium]|nr:hypothetical protein [Bacteroidota bacterium]
AAGGANITPSVLTNQTDNPIQRTFSNNGTTVEQVAFSITASAAGCSSQPLLYNVNVNPKPTVIFPPNPPVPQVCSGTNFTPVPLQSNITIQGVSYSWTAAAFDPVNPTSAIGGFSSPNSGNNIPGENIWSSLLTQGVIKFTVTPAFTSSSVSCPGDPMVYNLLVNPSPTVILSQPQPICSGSMSEKITFTPNASPTTYTWIAENVSGVSGAILNGTTDSIPAQTLFTTDTVQGFVKYKVTPSYQGGGTFTCPGGVSYSTIKVNPLPLPSISGNDTACELGPNKIYFTPDISGHSYQWAVTGGTFTSSPLLNQISVAWGASAASPGILTVTETIDVTGCNKTTVPFTVTLQQRPIPQISGASVVCDGSTGNVYTTQPGMTNYSWTISGGIITTGGGATNSTATVTWNSPGSQWIEANFINSLGCPGYPAFRLPVTVNPLPDTTITQGTVPNCEGGSQTYQTSFDPQCTYKWVVLPTSKGIIASGQGTNVITINWLTTGTATISLTDTNNVTGCVLSNSHLIVIHPKPIPVFASCFDTITTPGAKKFTLRGAAPYIQGQSKFTGTRVGYNSSTGFYEFDPSGAVAGIYPVTYTFTNNFGCSASTLPRTITIQNNSFSCGGDLTDVRDGKRYKTGMVGGRCWMTQNLVYGTTLASSYQSQTDNCVNEKYCEPTDAGCKIYGGLYQWDELMKYGNTSYNQGLCPPEWHVPTEADWQLLVNNVAIGVSPPADGISGGFLKDMRLNPGFFALLKGVFYLNSDWSFTTGLLTATMYWTSTSNAWNQPLARGVNIFNPSVSRYWSSRENAFPVRCLKD